MHRTTQYESPSVFELLAVELLDRASLCKQDRLLDVACGSGVVGREAIRQGIRYVAGMDIHLPRLRAGGLRTSCQARAEALPFSDGAFSLVVCQHGLMFFEDRASSLREASRVLRAHGRFAATCWRSLDENPGFLALHRAIAADLGPDAAASAARPFSLPDPDVVAHEIEAAGFSRVTVETIDVPIVSRSIEEFAKWYLFGTSIAQFAEGRADAVSSVLGRVAEDLASYLEPNGVVLPAKAYCVWASLG